VRAVLDTNVLLSALAIPGLCGRALDLLTDSPSHQIILSEYILEEFVRQYRAKFGMTLEETRKALEYLRGHARLIQPSPVSKNACRDQEDIAILGTLQASQADCLITGDTDLLSLGQFAGRPILSPRQAYERLK
jgi:uncharacterized protein